MTPDFCQRASWFFLRISFGILGLLAVADMAPGAGFALYEGSARGNSLGGSLVARADDPSALFYNPAGITQLPGFQLMGGTTAILPKTDVVTIEAGTKIRSETENNVWIPPHLYSTCQYTDSIWFGLGIFSRFGQGTEFDETWPGRYNSYNAVIQTLTVNPNVAFKVNDRLSLGVGASWMWLDLTLEQKIDFGKLSGNPSVLDVDQSLTGDSCGYGFNLALHYRAFDWMSLGVSYCSRIKQKMEGEADFSRPSGVPASMFNDTRVSGETTFPDMAFFGVTLYPVDRLTVEVDGVWTGWSTYDKFTIDYRDPILSDVRSITKEKKWDDVWRLQVGVEYKALDWLDLRLGYVWDDSPIPGETADYIVPGNDRHLYSLGCGLNWREWIADFSYTYLYVERRSVNARPEDGVLGSRFENGHVHLIGFSLSYRF